MPTAVRPALYATLACGALLWAAALANGETTPSPAASELTAERVERLQREVEAANELPEEVRVAAGEALRAALVELTAAAEFSARAEAFAEETTSVGDRVAEAKRQLDAVPSAAQALEDGSLPDLQKSLSELELRLAAERKALASAEAQPQTRAQRRKEVRARIAAVQESLKDAGSPTPATAANKHATLDVARGAERTAHRMALQQELLSLESELAKYDAEETADLLRLRADLASRQASHTEKAVQRLTERVKVLREADAADSVRKAHLEAVVATPVLKSHAERNQALAETAQAIARKLSQAEQDLKAAQDALSQLSKQFERARNKVETVGLTSSVGALLRKQRTTLPDTSLRQASVSARRSLIDETQYQLFEYGDERQELGDVDELARSIVAEAGAQDGDRAAFLEKASRELLDRKRDYLDSLLKTCNKYFDTLVELDTTDQQVVSLSRDYADFIDERVLWIRSGKLLSKDFGVDDSDLWLVNPSRWGGLAEALLGDARRHPVAYLAVASLFLFVLSRGRPLRRRLAETGEAAAKVNCRTLRPTLDAGATTLLIALAWPAACVLMAWRVGQAGGHDPFALAVGQGLLFLGLVWAPLELFRQVCRPRGLGEAHFAWAASTTEGIRRRLRWFTFLALPFAFLSAALLAIDKTNGHDSIERLAFIAGMLTLGLFAFRMLSPTGVLRGHVAYHPGGWVDRLRLFWPWLAAATPVSLAGLAFAGYYYTAQVLSLRLFVTCCFLSALVVLRSLLLRMLFLRRRALSIDQARERAAAANAAAAAAGEPGSSAAVAGIVTETPQSDLSAHSLQTRRLLTTGMFAASIVGLWLIWVQVLPALGMLDRYPLWSNSPGAAVAMAAPSPMGVAAPTGAADQKPAAAPRRAASEDLVTLSDLALALLIVFVTFVLARNGPGLLEMSVLQQLPLDASVRYAITTLVSYAIVLVGVVVSCSTIGLQWSQVQWLATALTFGLAFGLQEMFANFVAGLIILLERPIRVGDVVTVDDVSGVVSKIRIRATSITNWDRKEYVVPNKEFITGRLLNWTLSDKVNRIVINIGVAYGSDTDRARELLLEAANNHPLVLKDPPSIATFEGFGDNSLNLVLRAYLESLDGRLDVIHELHTAIDKAFRAEKIEIAFPQRDLHIRTAPGGLKLALDAEQAAPNESQEAA